VGKGKGSTLESVIEKHNQQLVREAWAGEPSVLHRGREERGKRSYAGGGEEAPPQGR